MLENEIWKSGRNLPLTSFGSERVKTSIKVNINLQVMTRSVILKSFCISKFDGYVSVLLLYVKKKKNRRNSQIGYQGIRKCFPICFSNAMCTYNSML